MDIRLNPVTSFSDPDEALKEMGMCRLKFGELDNILKECMKLSNSEQELRCINIARESLEKASMYTIKSICLKWEKK